MPGAAYLLVGVGAPEDMSIVSFMLLATGFGWLKDKIRGLHCYTAGACGAYHQGMGERAFAFY